MSLKKFPTTDGWLHADLTLKPSAPIGDTALKAIKHNLFGPPETHEFGLIEQHGKRLRIIARSRRQPVVVAALKEGK